MNHFGNELSVKLLSRQALCLEALLLLSIGSLLAQTPANKAAHKNDALLPKIPLSKAKTIAFKLHHFVSGQVPNGEPDQQQLDDVALYEVQVRLPLRLRILDVTSTYPSRFIKDNKGHVHGILPKMNYVGDGKQQLEWDKSHKDYLLFPAAASLADPGKDVEIALFDFSQHSLYARRTQRAEVHR